MRLFNRHRVWQAVVDAGLIAVAWYLAFWLRFDEGIPVYYDRLLDESIYVLVPLKLAVFVLFGFYSHWWRYVSIRDMWAVVRGVTVATIVAEFAVYLINPVSGVRVPRSVIVFDWLIVLALVAGARLLARTIIERPGPRGPGRSISVRASRRAPATRASRISQSRTSTDRGRRKPGTGLTR